MDREALNVCMRSTDGSLLMAKYLRNKRGLRKANAAKTRKFLGPWFRVYSSDIDDYRIQCLPVQVRWAWLELSCLAAANGGILPDNDQMAFRLRCAPHEIAAAIDVLISSGLVIQSCAPGDGPDLRMAGWEERQYVVDLSTSRVRRLRERRRQAETDGNGDETFHETQNETVKLSSHLLSQLVETSLRSIHESSTPGANDSKPGGVDGSRLGGEGAALDGGAK